MTYNYIHTQNTQEQLIRLARQGDIVQISNILDSGVVNIDFNEGELIRTATSVNNVEMVRRLIQLGANPRIQQDTPLYIAIRDGLPEMSTLLMQSGSTLLENCVEHLYIALQEGFLPIIQHLFSQNIIPLEDQHYSLRQAANNNHLQIVQYLIQYGVDANQALSAPANTETSLWVQQYLNAQAEYQHLLQSATHSEIQHKNRQNRL